MATDNDRADQSASPRFIYKIEAADTWARAEARGEYTGSADDHRDGFIHFSTAAQVAGTFTKYFAGKPDLVLVQVEADRLGPVLRWEPSRGGQLFPHLYAGLAMHRVTWVRPLTRADGAALPFPAEMI